MTEWIETIVREHIENEGLEIPLTEEQVQLCISLAQDAVDEAIYETVSDFLCDPDAYERKWQ